jgi:signal transduction histidine kinase
LRIIISNNKFKDKICIFIGLIFLLSSYNSYAQTNQLNDSLIAELQYSEHSDSVKILLLNQIAKKRSLAPSERLRYANELIALSQTQQDQTALSKAYILLGHIHKQTGDTENALSAYFNSAQLSQTIKDNQLEALAYSAIGSVYRVDNNFQTALIYYNKGINSLREIGDIKNLSISLMNTGELYRVNGIMDTALAYFKEADVLFDSIAYAIGKAYNLGNMGLVYAAIDQNDTAKAYIEEAIKILKSKGEYSPIIVYNLAMADIYIDKKQLNTAIDLLKTNLKVARDNGLKEQIRDLHSKLTDLYAQGEDYQKAYYHRGQYVLYKDSISNLENVQKLAELRTNFEVNKKQTEVDLLEEQQKRQNIIFIGLVVIILLLGILLFLYYRNYKRKQALNMIITERKEEAEAQRDQLEAINETKEKFLSIVSHDLLGPVNSFKGLSTIMKASIEAKDYKDLQQIHQLFDKSVNNLSTLLTNLLDWSVTQQGAIPYAPEKIVVSDLVNELLSLFSNMAATKNIQLQSTIANNITVWADENSLKTIFRNLVSNAIKFTQNNGEIILSNLVLDDTIGIAVTDTGLGMPQEKIDQLLSKDAFSHSQGTSGEKGVGLGLQLVKEFTEANQGALSIESKEGKGTTITVYLPLRKAV